MKENTIGPFSHSRHPRGTAAAQTRLTRNSWPSSRELVTPLSHYSGEEDSTDSGRCRRKKNTQRKVHPANGSNNKYRSEQWGEARGGKLFGGPNLAAPDQGIDKMKKGDREERVKFGLYDQ